MSLERGLIASMASPESSKSVPPFVAPDDITATFPTMLTPIEGLLLSRWNLINEGDGRPITP